MKKDELFFEMYKLELERKGKYNENLSFHIALLTLLIGAIIYFVQNKKKLIFNFLIFCL
jgi:hypothetical protein